MSLRLACLVLCFPSLAPAQQAREPLDLEAIKVLRAEGLGENSRVMDHLSWMCDVYGPRLTGSPNLKKAQQWAVATFKKWGLHNPHTEEWGPFGRGWRLDHFNIEVVGDNPWKVHAYPKAWSPSIPKPVRAEIVHVAHMNANDLRAMDLSNKIVLIESTRDVSEPFDGLAVRFDAEALLDRANRGGPAPRASSTRRGGRRGRGNRNQDPEIVRDFRRQQAVRRLVFQKGPLAILDRGRKGDYGTIFVSAASPTVEQGTPRNKRPRAWQKGAKVIPQFTLAVEHYNRLCRMLAKGVKVEMGLELRGTFFDDDPMERNVIAEIKGTDPKIGDQIVMIGAHFDSWHSGTGSTDNGCGSAVMMEAMRLLTVLQKKLGRGPRRTIRVALWSGEEQGIHGSREYVKQHFATARRGAAPTGVKPEYQKLAGYFNLDNGTGKIRGVYMEGMESVRPIFRRWLGPFRDLGASTLTAGTTGGTDHLSYQRVYLPGFQFIQDPAAYGTRTHHSNMDNWDHAIAADLKQAATIIASFAWHTAQRDKMLPRKAWPKPEPKKEEAEKVVPVLPVNKRR